MVILLKKLIDQINQPGQLLARLKRRPETTGTFHATSVPADMLAHFKQGFVIPKLLTVEFKMAVDHRQLVDCRRRDDRVVLQGIR